MRPIDESTIVFKFKMDEDEDDECVYDVIVLGAGLSGLVAARTLVQRDPHIRVLVLEQSLQPGGRILTHHIQVTKISQVIATLFSIAEGGGGPPPPG